MDQSTDTTRYITYLILEYVGILLLLFIIFHCVYRSTGYTLLIFCIVTILNSINETFLLIHYHTPLSRAYGSVSCTVEATFEHFIPLSLVFLSACMAFNVWFLIVWKAQYSERELLPFFCLFSFGLSAIATAIALILLRNRPYFSAYPRNYYCEFKNSYTIFGTYAIPMFVAAITGVTLTLNTVIYLMIQYRKIRRTINSGSFFHANPFIGFSQCVRLIIFSIGIGTIVIMACLEKFVGGVEGDEPYSTMRQSLDITSDFSGSLIAYFIFVIFGTTKDSLKTLSMIFCACWKRKKEKGKNTKTEINRNISIAVPKQLSPAISLSEYDDLECSPITQSPPQSNSQSNSQSPLPSYLSKIDLS